MRILKRKFLTLLLSLVTVFAFSVNANAAYLDVQTIDLGDGFTAVITEEITIQPLSHTIEHTKTITANQGSTKIGKFSLTGTFVYTGSNAAAIDSSCSATGYNGWSSKNAFDDYSGAKVFGECTFYKGSTSKTVSLSMTCSPDGDIS